MSNTRRSHPIVWACAMLAVIAAVVSWPADAQPGDRDAVDMAMRKLAHPLRGKVVVNFAGGGSLEGVTVTGPVEVFGRKYIGAKGVEGHSLLINPDHVRAFRVIRQK